MNSVKSLKNINQVENYTKSHTFTTNDYTISKFDIIKLIPNIKDSENAIIRKINAPAKLSEIYSNKNLNIIDFIIDNGYIYITGYFYEDITITDINKKKIHGKISEKGYTDIFLAKLYNNSIIFIKFITGLKNDKACSIKIDKNGDIYICGYYTDSITFDTVYLSSKNNKNKNVFVAKLNSKTFEWIWAKDAGKNETDSKGLNIFIYEKYIYLCGYFDKQIKFDVIPSINISTNNRNIFIQKMNIENGDNEWINNTVSEYDKKLNDSIIKNNKLYILSSNINKKIITVSILNIKNNKWILLDKPILDIDIERTERTEKKENIFLIFKSAIRIDIKNNIYISYNLSNNISYIIKYDQNFEMIWKNEVNFIINDLNFDENNYMNIVGSINNDNVNNILKINDIEYKKVNKNDLIFMKLYDTGKIFLYEIIGTKNEKNYIKKILIYNEKIFMMRNKNELLEFQFDDRKLKCIGIVKAINNGIIDIEFSGNIGTNYNNLIAGNDYFIQENGKLDIIPNDFYFGTAITNEKLLINNFKF